MSESLTHIILTPFNSYWDSDHTLSLDPSWITDRWDLFTRYTVPSLLAQSCQRFHWVVEFHPKSPPFLKSLVQAAGWPSHFIPSFGERERISQLLRFSDSSVILTTRIDSDDAYHRDAVYRIQNAGLDCDVLNFEHGFQCDHVTGCVALVHRHCSAFSTKVNRSSRGDDPFDVGGDHSFLSKKYSYTDISGGDPMFLQVLHGKNVGNSWYGHPFNNRALSALILTKCFNVEQSQFPLAQRLMRMARFEVQRLPRQAKKAFVSYCLSRKS
jgi:hypothetical protein